MLLLTTTASLVRGPKKTSAVVQFGGSCVLLLQRPPLASSMPANFSSLSIRQHPGWCSLVVLVF
jgi:hypothetical protein